MSIWKNLSTKDLISKVNDIHLIITKHREEIKIVDLLTYIQEFKFIYQLINLMQEDITKKYEDICSFVDQTILDIDHDPQDQLKEFATTTLHTKKLDHHIDNARILYDNRTKTFVIKINNRVIDGIILDITKEIPWSSWMYDPDSTKHTRKVGGRSTITLDLARLSKKQKQCELELRKKQLMHDILVYMQIYDQL